VRWTVFTDPNEHAFTIDVPEGWRVQGGTRRVAANSVQHWLVAVSPDGGIELFLGHPDLRYYTVPSQWLAMSGFREGTVLPDQSVARRYLPGVTFASQWGGARIAQSCTGVSPKGARALPSRQIGNDFAAMGIRLSVSAGEAGFACNLRGAPGVGYVSAATLLAESQGSSIWIVEPVVGFIASTQQASQAAILLSHVAESFAKDQHWEARQGQTNRALSRIASDTLHAVTKSSSESFKNRSASLDRVFKGQSQTTLGVGTYQNQVTGDRFTLDSSPACYWSAAGKNPTPGNCANPPPGADWTKMQRVQPGK